MWDKEFDVAKKAVLEAGELLRSYFRNIKTYDKKKDSTLVSKADKEAEEILFKTLKTAFPDSEFIGEEGGVHKGNTGFRRRWTVDPLDGTTNFLCNIPHYCISLGMAFDGEWVIGMVYDPQKDELFHAKKGEGAFCNDRKISMRGTTDFSEAVIAFGRAFSSVYSSNIHELYDFFSKVRAVRSMGSAALDLAHLADGRYDLFFCKELKIWDTAGAFVILKEVGAKISQFDGSAYEPAEANIIAGQEVLVDGFLEKSFKL